MAGCSSGSSGGSRRSREVAERFFKENFQADKLLSTGEVASWLDNQFPNGACEETMLDRLRDDWQRLVTPQHISRAIRREGRKAIAQILERNAASTEAGLRQQLPNASINVRTTIE